MRVEIKRAYKSISKIQDFDLPDFVVLTGKNGSGKSHLMELIARNVDCLVFDDSGSLLQRIKYIPFGGLNPQVDDNCEYLSLTNNRKQAWKAVEQKITEYNQYKRDPSWDIERYYNLGGNRKNILGKWIDLTNGDVDAITEEFFAEHYEISSNEILSGHIASIFKLYQIRLLDNDVKAYLNEKRNQKNHVLSDEEFKKIYGPKPWDLINNMLSRSGLTYQVNHPEESHKELDFKLRLTDSNTGVEINVNDLSTGEKVLMSLALSVYNAKEATARPDVLLLDEPDAPMHPEFSKILMDAIVGSLVNDSGIKVILSTHSPVTVALAPEDSIYVMDKELCKPMKMSKHQAVNILTRDLDNIRLSYENRRQVFVESKYDVQYYSKILKLISQELPTNPQFLPPRSSDGSNCDDVKVMVNELRGMGNDLVYGITDFDNKNHSNGFVLVLGEGKRYAIDNYIFDPIYVSFLLIEQRIITTEAMGLPPLSFVQLGQLDETGIQKMIDYVIKELGLTGTTTEYIVQSGSKFIAIQEYFMFRGHDLETMIKDKWKPLNRIAYGSDNVLKNYMLDHVCYNYPGFLSNDFTDLFMNIK